MKAIVTLELKAETAESAQKIMEELFKELLRKQTIASYRYEIETTEGPVTDRCILTDGKVIA